MRLHCVLVHSYRQSSFSVTEIRGKAKWSLILFRLASVLAANVDVYWPICFHGGKGNLSLCMPGRLILGNGGVAPLILNVGTTWR